MPGPEKIVLLVRNSLIALHQAIQTGNFTVLRDLGAPGFREANSAAKLSASFADLSSKKINLGATAVLVPELTQPPSIDEGKGMLHLQGRFPGDEMQIDFELLFQAIDGQWRLFGLSVQPSAGSHPPIASPAPGSTALKETE
ncbi:hypothetical protein [Methyloligella solikamskensis]|uniref:DUF4440 domain-containing protein n=1 Tax=Methyloligella solikamskensis TaxID=1177756 RepID=A0ABW3J8R6_9HYPH